MKKRLWNKNETGDTRNSTAAVNYVRDGDGLDNVGSIRSGESDWVKVYSESQTHNMLINQVGGHERKVGIKDNLKAFDLCNGHVVMAFNIGRQ